MTAISSMAGVRRLTTKVFRAIIWGWFALGLTCLLIEGLLFGHPDGQRSNAAPVEHSLITPYGASLSYPVR